MSHFKRLFLLPLLCAAAVFGQADANKGQIFGTVYDSKQSAVPEATVKIRNTGTGLVRDLKTNTGGQYRAVQLDPGAYDITAESKGFAVTTLQGVLVSVGSSIGLDITLQVQASTTTVEVSASLMTELPAPTTVISTKEIENLPINGRRFQDFALL